MTEIEAPGHVLSLDENKFRVLPYKTSRDRKKFKMIVVFEGETEPAYTATGTGWGDLSIAGGTLGVDASATDKREQELNPKEDNND